MTVDELVAELSADAAAGERGLLVRQATPE
jgi:hypothetical protein